MDAIFEPYDGDLMGLPVNKNHSVFKWVNDYGCKVLFSMTQQGKSLSCHFASNPAGLRHLREALNAFCNFCFRSFDCKMIVAKVTTPSVKRFILKHCGFVVALKNEGKDEYLCMRCKE